MEKFEILKYHEDFNFRLLELSNVLNIEKLDAYTMGYLLYFFMFACGVSGYILDVNPFNQPGVEDYKKNMFALLGKPGYEELRKELLKRL